MDGVCGLIGGIGRPVNCHMTGDFVCVLVDDTYEAGFDIVWILLTEPESVALEVQTIKADGLAGCVVLAEWGSYCCSLICL